MACKPKNGEGRRALARATKKENQRKARKEKKKGNLKPQEVRNVQNNN